MNIALPAPPPTAGNSPVSLYQQCLQLLEKLYSLPGFEFYLFPQGVDVLLSDKNFRFDPVNILWESFRLGSPLCALFNHLRPVNTLEVADVSSIQPGKWDNKCKKSVYHFLVACKQDLRLSEDDVFTISELYKDDTNGFVKVVKTVNIVVDKIEERGLFPPKRPLPFGFSGNSSDAPMDNRAKIINEMLDTERKYIQSLEELQAYVRELEFQQIVPKDIILQLFANLDELLDFQRRFLIAMEGTLMRSPNEQRVGQLFIDHEPAFQCYIPFCGNYQFATQLAIDEADRLAKLSHIIDPNYGLPSYLIKPVQRICKYPLLLNELIKYTDAATYAYMDELKQGLSAIKRVTDQVNEAKRKEENRMLKEDLTERVEDWKGLNVAEFGELLLSDKFPMASNDIEREYLLFLFERILLCCKDLAKKKKRSNKKGKDEEQSAFALKGNIYITSITGVLDTSRPDLQQFSLKVFWKDVNDMESFTLKCRNEEQVRMWKERLERLVEQERLRQRKSQYADMNGTYNMFSPMSPYPPGALPTSAQHPQLPPQGPHVYKSRAKSMFGPDEDYEDFGDGADSGYAPSVDSNKPNGMRRGRSEVMDPSVLAGYRDSSSSNGSGMSGIGGSGGPPGGPPPLPLDPNRPPIPMQRSKSIPHNFYPPAHMNAGAPGPPPIPKEYLRKSLGSSQHPRNQSLGVTSEYLALQQQLQQQRENKQREREQQQQQQQQHDDGRMPQRPVSTSPPPSARHSPPPPLPPMPTDLPGRPPARDASRSEYRYAPPQAPLPPNPYGNANGQQQHYYNDDVYGNGDRNAGKVDENGYPISPPLSGPNSPMLARKPTNGGIPPHMAGAGAGNKMPGERPPQIITNRNQMDIHQQQPQRMYGSSMMQPHSPSTPVGPQQTHYIPSHHHPTGAPLYERGRSGSLPDIQQPLPRTSSTSGGYTSEAEARLLARMQALRTTTTSPPPHPPPSGPIPHPATQQPHLMAPHQYPSVEELRERARSRGPSERERGTPSPSPFQSNGGGGSYLPPSIPLPPTPKTPPPMMSPMVGAPPSGLGHRRGGSGGSAPNLQHLLTQLPPPPSGPPPASPHPDRPPHLSSIPAPPPSSSLPPPPSHSGSTSSLNSSSASLSSNPNLSSSASNLSNAASATSFIKVKTHYGTDIYVIAVPARGCTYTELHSKIERKIRLCGAPVPEGK
ncbi:hypothetical protein HK102_005592, partial [Quaeritorhiza haematococci]